MKGITPNRIAVYLSAGAGLLTALVPAIAELNTASTIGMVGGFLGIATVVRKWLEGWQMYEERTQMGIPDEHKLTAVPDESPS